MGDEGPDPPDAARDERHRRGLKFRRRDDYAVELFKEALSRLDDRRRVDEILLQLGRFYNPYIDQSIVDPATRRRVLASLEDGAVGLARTLLEERLKLYARFDDAE
jgi:hypothetical protein